MSCAARVRRWRRVLVATTAVVVGATVTGAGSTGAGAGSTGAGVGAGSTGTGSVAKAGVEGVTAVRAVIAIAIGMRARERRRRWPNGAPFYQRVTHGADGGGWGPLQGAGDQGGMPIGRPVIGRIEGVARGGAGLPKTRGHRTARRSGGSSVSGPVCVRMAARDCIADRRIAEQSPFGVGGPIRGASGRYRSIRCPTDRWLSCARPRTGSSGSSRPRRRPDCSATTRSCCSVPTRPRTSSTRSCRGRSRSSGSPICRRPASRARARCASS